MTSRSEAARLLSGAQWISPGMPVPAAGNRPGYEFRRTFSLSSTPSHSVLTATAHGVYEAFINGRRVGDIELAPGATSYQRTLYVQRYDVADLLVIGGNEVRFVVTDGWFRGRCGPDRVADNWGADIGLLASLSAEGFAIETDTEWQVAEGSIVAADLMDGQFTDLRRIGTERWARAVLSTDPLVADRTRLAWSPSPPVRAREEFRPRSVRRLASGRQIVDFGQILNGRVRLSSLGGHGVRTDLAHGESLDAAGDLTLSHLAFAPPWKPAAEVGQHDIVISRGEPGDVFEPRHTTHGFRYVAVDGRNDDLTIEDITAVQLRTDLERIGSFWSSSDDLNALHRIAVASWHGNTCDIPTDCPQRERWGYTGDIQIFARSAAFLDDVQGFLTKWLRSLADDQFASGLIPNVAPLCGVVEDPMIPFSLDGAAGWGDAATVVPWELYRSYGDVSVLEEFFPMMASWVRYAASVAASGRHPSRIAARAVPAPHEKYLWDSGWQWGEWLEPDAVFDPTADQGIIATAYLALSARIVADTAEILGLAPDAAEFRELERGATAAWRTEFLHDDGSLTTPTQANYARSLAFGLIPEDRRAAGAARLAGLISANGGRLSTGFLSTGLLLPALADNGYDDVAYELLFQRHEPSWMTMLDRGATTVWEAWDGVDENGVARDSLNHYSKGAVVTFLHEYVAGIRPATAGYREVLFAPHPHPSLTSAGARLKTRHGEVRSSWSRHHEEFVHEVTLPEGTTGTVELPDGTRVEFGPGTHTLRSAIPAHRAP